MKPSASAVTTTGQSQGSGLFAKKALIAWIILFGTILGFAAFYLVSKGFVIGNVKSSVRLIVDYLPLGFAFGAGMISAVNPCAFSLLPVYLSLYVGGKESESHRRSPGRRTLKALYVALILILGVGVLFGTIGAVVSLGGTLLFDFIPWFALPIGFGLVLLGVWRSTGRSLSAGFVRSWADRIGDPRENNVKGFFLFGMAFGATSLSCMLPIFLVVAGIAAAAGGFLPGMAQFLSFSLGMGLMLLVLTLAAALMKEGVVVGKFRKIIPYGRMIATTLLVAAGGLIIYNSLFIGGLYEKII